MFYPIENGSVCNVEDNAFGYVFQCQLPPVGYGKNIKTGKVEKTDTFCRSEVPEEQYFERIPLPKNFNERRKDEQVKQQTNRNYFDPYLEKFRVEEWHRRYCGVWFMNFNPDTQESEWTYLTGQQWLYNNWWIYQGKRMDFRIPDKETFYVMAYCQEDPLCLGGNEITPRKSGKTGRIGSVAYERTSRMKYHHCGLQSKSDEDGETTFKKSIVDPWKKLPHFYRPTYNLMKGEDPNELSFFPTPRRGQQAEMSEPEKSLESFMDYGTSEEGFYDGPELHTYISDETAKTRSAVSIRERMRVVREATEIGGIITGFHWSTTTVELDKSEEENKEFYDFCMQSNPLERDDNGMTVTGYYTLFQPAIKYAPHDIYGHCDRESALRVIMNRRKKLEEIGDYKGLASYKRKKPLYFMESFSAVAGSSLYNPIVLGDRLDAIRGNKHYTERGDLVWEDGIRFKKKIEGTNNYEISKVVWVNNPNGRWERIKGWQPEKPNNIKMVGELYSPENYNSIRMSCDPFKYDKTKTKRNSKCSSVAYQLDKIGTPEMFKDSFPLRYFHRAETTRLANEDILKMSWWCGTKVLFERNVDHWIADFEEWNCKLFLEWMPGEVLPGIYMGTARIQDICNFTERYIKNFINKVFFVSFIEKPFGWLGFKVDDTEDFDEPMAIGICLISVNCNMIIEQKVINIQDIFPMRKIG